MLKKYFNKTVVMLFISFVMLIGFFTNFSVSAENVSNLQPVDSTYEFIKSVEGYSSQCFWDVAQWTIGYGNKCPYTHTTNGVRGQKGGHTISETQARELFSSKLSGYVSTLKSNCKGLSMTQNQFDALLSATYNHGNVNDCPLKYYLQGKLTESEARTQYYEWHINKGTDDEKGLRNRRKKEADLFFSEQKLNAVTIHYNANGGTVASDSKYYIGSGNDLYRKSDDKLMGPTWEDGYKDKDGLVNASTIKLTRTGYHFVGWSLSKSGGKIFDQDDNTVSANDLYPDVKSKNGTVMLYAQWELNKVRMLYNANGGTIESGGTYSANDDGYICKDGNTMPLSPIWENGYTDPNGLYNASTFKLTRTGYHFIGWSTSKSGGKIFDQDDSTVSANDLLPSIDSKSDSITLYAQWEQNKLTINYNSNGGNIASGGDYYTDSNGGIFETSTKALKEQNWAYNKGGTNGLCNASTFKLVRTGYHFVGWSTSKSGGKIYDQDDTSLLSNDISTDVKTKNVKVTMYAQWEENIVTVRYNTNGGISMAESPEFYTKDNYVYRKADSSEVKSQWKYGQTVANGFYDCTSFDMYREGYKFVGWGTSATGGTVYSDTAELKINSLCDLTSKSVDMIVYAQWEKVPSTIDLYQNTSGLNYMLGSDFVGSEKEIHPDNIEHSSVKFDSLNTHNGQPIVNVNALQADSKHTYTHLVTKTSLTACASNGAYPESKKYYLSFYAKAPQSGSTLEVRWGYDGVYKKVELSTDWKWYIIEMQKVPVSDNWIHWYFNKTGNYQFSHLMVTDDKCIEGSFVAESENSPISKMNYTIGKVYGKLPVPEREGYDFIGWFTSRDGDEEITADTIAEKGVTLYAHWKKSAEIQGDVNADGEFNVADAVLLQKWLLAVPDTDILDWKAADLVTDEKIDVFDFVMMKRKLIDG